jgi:hypothetical protein
MVAALRKQGANGAGPEDRRARTGDGRAAGEEAVISASHPRAVLASRDQGDDMTILYLLQAAFTIWMLVDAVRRRPILYWYVIIFLPFGPLVYFFAFKIHDYDLGWLRRIVSPAPPPPSVAELRERLRRSPSVANRLLLASALHDAGEYAEAAESFGIVLEGRADDPDALYGLGRCRMELGEPEAAVELLSKLVAKSRTYRDYAACLELAEALTKAGRDDEAIDLLEGVVRSSPRPQHSVALARHLIAAARIERAQEVLREAIADHERSPAALRRRHRDAAREAVTLLKSISSRG